MFVLKVENPDKLFITSDLHFNHFNICKYCHRPFENRADMNQALIDNWNSVVPEDGIVVCCGDFALPHKTSYKDYINIMSKLNGKIYLCRGNHDRIPLGDVPDDIKEANPDFGLVTVQDIMTIQVEGITILACHYPMLSYPTDYQVFGHIHTLSDGTCYGIDGDVNARLRKTQYDVGVDQNNYTPVSYWQLVDIFRNKAKEE